MQAIVISTGEELLRGRILDTNAAFLATELERQGFDMRRIVVVGDAPDHIREELVRAAADSALVVMTGGLGPTADDRMRDAIAAAVGRPLVEDADARRHVAERIRSFGREPEPRQFTQALFPEGSEVFANPNGTACGFACRAGESWMVAMPGVPGEMRPMFHASVVPFIRRALPTAECVQTAVVRLYPLPESVADERIADMSGFGRNPSLGITVSDGIISISVRAHADDEGTARRLLDADVAVLRERFADLVFGAGEATLAEALAEQLARRQVSVAVAESLTGGLVSHMLVGVPGISRWLAGSVVAYSNEVKCAQLGVPPELIQQHGAVSAEVAEAMARGICRATGARLGMGTTGIAGPGGGSVRKPVGLAYTAVCLDGHVQVERHQYRGDRERIRDRAAKDVLNAARLTLLRGVESAR
ncbi:MAG: competence/damage-inducible protein A [Candidatus Brocadiaceae bacterium]|nr:competence/damage-inducible protein A [Candidatus Brocadiaceae bacterium]